MAKHMTFEERSLIHQGLNEGMTLKAIAEMLGRSRSTIVREVMNRRTPSSWNVSNDCIHRKECIFPESCHAKGCIYPSNCRSCGKCISSCSRYEKELCEKLMTAPYVCNGCADRKMCRIRKLVYNPSGAQKEYERILRESREGISLSEEELVHIDEVISPLLHNGQSVKVACHNNSDDITVSERTIYTYIEGGLLSVSPIDLARTVQRRPRRKKSGPVRRVDRKCHEGRTYEDRENFMKENRISDDVQMDTVEGRKGGKCILTLYFTDCGLQLMYLRDRNTARTVTERFEKLKAALGTDIFSELFGVITTDRGSEFTDPEKIELEMDPSSGSYTERRISRVFYCDPRNSNQKSGCERNHEYIRMIIPKGKPMDNLDDEDVRLMMNHINSYARESLGMKAPVDRFAEIYGQETANLLGLEKIPPNEVKLSPELLKKPK